MKQQKTFSSLAISLIMLLATTSCSSDDEPTETPVLPDTRGIVFSGTGGKAYFTEGDKLIITATAKSEEPNYQVTYVYDAHAQWQFESGDILYYENLHNGNDYTHYITAGCGNPEVVLDQHTTALFHQADYIEGKLTLTKKGNTATLAGTLTRQQVLLDITLEPDDNSWETGEFANWFAGRKDDTTIWITNGYAIKPLITVGADGNSANLRAIASVEFAPYGETYILRVPWDIGDDEYQWLFAEVSDPPASPGTHIKITALCKRGEMECISVTEGAWTD